jgi:hypothetical protein
MQPPLVQLLIIFKFKVFISDQVTVIQSILSRKAGGFIKTRVRVLSADNQYFISAGACFPLILEPFWFM